MRDRVPHSSRVCRSFVVTFSLFDPLHVGSYSRWPASAGSVVLPFGAPRPHTMTRSGFHARRLGFETILPTGPSDMILPARQCTQHLLLAGVLSAGAVRPPDSHSECLAMTTHHPVDLTLPASMRAVSATVTGRPRSSNNPADLVIPLSPSPFPLEMIGAQIGWTAVRSSQVLDVQIWLPFVQTSRIGDEGSPGRSSFFQN